MTPDQQVPVWEQRLRAGRVSLPDWAADAPERCLYVSNATGAYQLYAWDRGTGTTRQVTSRANGTTDGALPPGGESIWWFDDTDGDEWGSWRRQPWAGGADEPATPGVPDSYGAGLALGRSLAVVGGATDQGCTAYVVRRGAEPIILYSSVHDADVAALSRDEALICIEHSEHGDSRYKALRVLTLTGEVVGELWDGEGFGLHCVDFSPVPGDNRVLAVHERAGRPSPMIWDPVAGTEHRLDLDIEGDLVADWLPDGSALLLHADAGSRSTLHRVDLPGDGPPAAAGQEIPIPGGTVLDATARPDGTVEYLWSTAASPPVIRSTSGAVVLTAPGPRAPASVPVEDVVVDGPGGAIHALIARPDGAGPFPLVFLVHGGPTYHDSDAFAGDRAAYIDLGCAVAQVNYRGSTGYGAAWRDALTGRPGLTELEDLAAVRQWAVASGLTTDDRCVLTGGSWGGYLTLLGLGTQPELWAGGVASVPVADYVAAYEDEMEPLKAFDRSLFGGSPDEVPEVYTRCSPLTYVEHVRAPLLILAGANDPRCPIRQVDNYLRALVALGRQPEVYRYDAGHGSLVVDERVRQLRVELDFVARLLAIAGPA